jgi:hypothetical protein
MRSYMQGFGIGFLDFSVLFCIVRPWKIFYSS